MLVTLGDQSSQSLDPRGQPTSCLSRGSLSSAPSLLGEHSGWQRLDLATVESKLGNLQGGRFLVEEIFLHVSSVFCGRILFLLRKTGWVRQHPRCNDFISNPYHRPYCAGHAKCKLCVASNTHTEWMHIFFLEYDWIIVVKWAGITVVWPSLICMSFLEGRL